MVRGEQTKRMYEWPDAGPIDIEPWTRPAQPATSFFRNLAMCLPLKHSSAKRLPRQVTSPEGDQCRRESVVSRVIDELKRSHALGQRCRCRVVPYLNNIVEQDHRAIKRRINASLGFRSLPGQSEPSKAMKQCT